MTIVHRISSDRYILSDRRRDSKDESNSCPFIGLLGLAPSSCYELAGTETLFAELLRFNIKSRNWTVVSPAAGQTPTGRYGHGFASLEGMLYVFGGQENPGGDI